MSFFSNLADPNYTSPDVFDRTVNQGRRPLRKLNIFIMRKMYNIDYFRGLVRKLYKTYQSIIHQLSYFEVSGYELLELVFSVFFVIPIQLISITYRFLLKPEYYYLLRTSIDDVWYASLRMTMYNFINNLLMIGVYIYMNIYGTILYRINTVTTQKGEIDKTNNILNNQVLIPHKKEYENSHIIYTPDGIGTQFQDIGLIQNFINNMEYVNMTYFGFQNKIMIKHHRTHPILQSIFDKYADPSPYDQYQQSYIEIIINWFFRATFVDYGALNNDIYRKRLVDDFVNRVRLENPKTFSLVGMSHGGFNVVLIVSELLKRSNEFYDVLEKLTSVMLLGTSVQLLSDFSYNINNKRNFPIYQIYSPRDTMCNLPFTPESSGIAIKNLYVIPINTLNCMIDPHLSFFMNPNLYEYVSHLTVDNAHHLKEHLKRKPSHDIKVYQTIIA